MIIGLKMINNRSKMMILKSKFLKKINLFLSWKVKNLKRSKKYKLTKSKRSEKSNKKNQIFKNKRAKKAKNLMNTLLKICLIIFGRRLSTI